MRGGCRVDKIELSQPQRDYLQTLLPRGYCFSYIGPHIFEEKRSRKPKKTDEIYQSEYYPFGPAISHSKEQERQPLQSPAYKAQQRKEKQISSHVKSVATKPKNQVVTDRNLPVNYCQAGLVNKRVSRYSRGKSKSLCRPAPQKTCKSPHASIQKKEAKSKESPPQATLNCPNKDQSVPIDRAEVEEQKPEKVHIREQRMQQLELNRQTIPDKVQQYVKAQSVKTVNNQARQNTYAIDNEVHPTIQQHNQGHRCRNSNQEMLLRFVSKLKTHKASWPFRQPVDPVSQGVPNYLSMIKHPMDLKTIERKTAANKYDNFGQFKCDVSQILLNSYKFNPKETKYFSLTVQLEDYYHKLLQENHGFQDTDKSGKIYQNRSLEGTQQKGKKSIHRKIKASFSVQEKIKIGQKIGGLSSDSLEQALLMIYESEGQEILEDQMVFNINLQKLSEATLRRLDNYFLLKMKDSNYLPEDYSFLPEDC